MTDHIEALSEREKEALRLLLGGHDAKSIARDLDLSVHSVNERLRSARRKLGVSSSREAARLLGAAEQSAPNSLGHKEFGLTADALTSDKGAGRSGLPFFKRPVILVLGGTLLMSFIIAAAVLAWTIPQDSREERPSRWGQITALSDAGSEVRNVIRLDGNSVIWNGTQITEANLRQYLDITTQMSPQPVLVLSYSAQTKSARIEVIRSVIEEVLQCTPSNCRELTLPPGE